MVVSQNLTDKNTIIIDEQIKILTNQLCDYKMHVSSLDLSSLSINKKVFSVILCFLT